MVVMMLMNTPRSEQKKNGKINNSVHPYLVLWNR